jgi:hypothetical protein
MKKIVAAASLVIAPLAVAGCHSGHAAAAKSSTHAFASSSQGQYDKAQAQAIVKKCLPSSEAAQLKLAEPVKGKTARAAVGNCLKIPGANRQAFDNALISGAVSGKLTTKAGRIQFAEVTVPALLVKYQ